MTDITRDEAIEAMRKGEPCETFQRAHADWRATCWHDFEYDRSKFRRPPEPQREAREWWISPAPKGKTNYDYAFSAQCSTGVHVREVLPGDVVVQRMTRQELYAKAQEWGIGGDEDRAAALVAIHNLGLLEEPT